jgi:hypothetical protein
MESLRHSLPLRLLKHDGPPNKVFDKFLTEFLRWVEYCEYLGQVVFQTGVSVEDIFTLVELMLFASELKKRPGGRRKPAGLLSASTLLDIRLGYIYSVCGRDIAACCRYCPTGWRVQGNLEKCGGFMCPIVIAFTCIYLFLFFKFGGFLTEICGILHSKF